MKRAQLQEKKVSAISLGCDKNKVDLEKMLGRIKAYGLEICEDITQADIVIVNTCAFILPAQKEAIIKPHKLVSFFHFQLCTVLCN